MKEKSDNELMDLICTRNEKAFSELYDRYAQKLLRFMNRLLNYNEEKAKDMLQDVFVKIIQQPELYNSSKAFSPWVYRVCANICRNDLRNSQNRNRINKVIHSETDFIVNTSVINSVDLDLFRKHYKVLFETLDEEQQLLLVLHFQEEMLLKDIAVVMGIPEGTVRSRLFYLLKKFSVLLKEFDPKQN